MSWHGMFFPKRGAALVRGIHTWYNDVRYGPERKAAVELRVTSSAPGNRRIVLAGGVPLWRKGIVPYPAKQPYRVMKGV